MVAPLFGEAALDRFRVIRPIRPGYGHSRAPTEPRSLAAHARACAELLHRLDVDRAYWVGHSPSCCIGLQLALDEPGLEAARVSVPTLVVNGETTRPWFKENVALLAELLPNARTATVKGADHLTPLTHPAELAASVAGFVDSYTRGDESMVSGSQTTTTARRPT